MLNFSNSKVLSIYLIFILISIFSLTNFINIDNSFLKKKINLGLDLQGGSYLLLEVDSSSLEKKRLQSRVVPLKKKLRIFRICLGRTFTKILSYSIPLWNNFLERLKIKSYK